MNQPLNIPGFTFDNPSSSGNMSSMSGVISNTGRRLSQELCLHGTGAIRESELGHVVNTANDTVRLYKSLSDIAMASEAMDAARHSAFAVFCDAVQDKTQSRTIITSVASGGQYTGYAKDLMEGYDKVARHFASIEQSSPESVLNPSNYNFADAADRAKYIDSVKHYSANLNLSSPMQIPQNAPISIGGEVELQHRLSDRHNFAEFIKASDNIILEEFRIQHDWAKADVLYTGFKGNLDNNNALEAFKQTLTNPSDIQAVEHLITANINAKSRIFEEFTGQIMVGGIDTQELFTKGTINGYELDKTSLSVAKQCYVLTCHNGISTDFHNKILQNIGYTSKYESLDLMNHTHVAKRVNEFEKALNLAGYGTFHGKALSKLSIKELNQIDVSVIKDANVAKALETYKALRNHSELLKKGLSLQQNMIMNVGMIARKVFKDSDLGNGIGRLMSLKQNVNMAMSIWRKIGAPLYKKFSITPLGREAIRSGNNGFQSSLRLARSKQFATKSQQGISKITQAASKKNTLQNGFINIKKAKIARAAKQAKKAQKVVKHSTRLARRATNQLTKSAGRKISGKLARELAKKGVQVAAHGFGSAAGTAGTIGASGTGAAGASGATGAAAGTAGGVSLGTVATVVGVVMLVMLILYLKGTFLSIVGQSVIEFNDTLMKPVEWLKDIWPWGFDEDEATNVLNYTIHSIIDLEKQSKGTGMHTGAEYDEDGNVTYTKFFFSGVYPTANKNSTVKVLHDNEKGDIYWNYTQFQHYEDENMPSNIAQYIFLDENGTPMNEYSTIRTVLSMAHAYTYNIESNEGIENFKLYATGLWKWINTFDLVAELEFGVNCGSQCGSFTYSCKHDDVKDSAYYSDLIEHQSGDSACVVPYAVSTGQKIEIKALEDVTNTTENICTVHSDCKTSYRRFYYLSDQSDITPRNSGGRACVYYKYEYVNGNEKLKETKYKNGTLQNTTFVQNTAIYQMSHRFVELYNGKSEKLKVNIKDYGFASGQTITENPTYFLFPYAASTCLDGKTSDGTYVGQCIDWTKWENGDIAMSDFLLIHNASEIKNGFCNNNFQHTYKHKTTTTSKKHCPSSDVKVATANYERTLYNNMRQASCSHAKKVELNHCNGHDTVYCTSSVVNRVTETQTHTIRNEGTFFSIKNTELLYNTSTTRCCPDAEEIRVMVVSDWDAKKQSNGYVKQSDVGSTYRVVYKCPGHTNHGYFDNSSNFVNTCKKKNVEIITGSDGSIHTNITYSDGFSKVTRYLCDGYTATQENTHTVTINVCRGHIECVGTKKDAQAIHATCPGHTIKYCVGHIKYTFIRTQNTSEEQIYDDTWSYVAPGNFLWWTTNTVYCAGKTAREVTWTDENGEKHTDTAKPLARPDWAGWNKSNKEVVAGMFNTDWFMQYNISYADFVGSRIDASEIKAFKEQYNQQCANISTANADILDAAFYSIGRVPFYPNDEATQGGYDNNGFFDSAEPLFNDRGYQIAQHGIGYEHYGAWIYMTAMGGDSYLTKEELPSILNNTTTWSTRVNEETPAGSIICLKDNGKVKTAILIGVSQVDGNLEVCFIAPSESGWVTIDKNMGTWYTHTSLSTQLQ